MRMSFFYRIFFLCIACFMVYFSFFQYKASQEKSENKRIQSLIFKDEIKAPDVLSLSSEKQDGSQLALKKTSKGWRLERPVEDKADTKKSEDLIKELLSQEVEVISKNTVDWGEYGLNPPFVLLKINTKTKEQSLGAAREANFDNRYFIKKGDELFLGSSDWQKLTRLWPEDYRSRRLYHFSGRPEGLRFKTKNKNYRFKYENHTWKWSSKALYPLSHSAFEGFWTSLRGDFIDGFTEEKSNTALKKPMWKQPDLELELLVSKEQPSSAPAADGSREDSKEQPVLWSLKLKKKEGKNFVVLSDRDYVFELSPGSADKLFNVDFRDHQAPFAFSLRKMNQVRIKAFDFDYLIEKQAKPAAGAENKPKDEEKGGWWAVLDQEGYQLSKDRFEAFLDWLGELKSLSYHKEKKFKKPAGEITVKDDKGENLLKMEFGSVFKKGEEELIYVRSSKSKQMMTIDYSDFKEVVSSSLIEKEAAAPDEEEASLKK